MLTDQKRLPGYFRKFALNAPYMVYYGAHIIFFNFPRILTLDSGGHDFRQVFYSGLIPLIQLKPQIQSPTPKFTMKDDYARR